MSLHQISFFSHWLTALLASLCVISPILPYVWEDADFSWEFPAKETAVTAAALAAVWLLSLTFLGANTVPANILFYIFYFLAAANPLFAFFSRFAHAFVRPYPSRKPFFTNKDPEKVFGVLLILLDGFYLALLVIIFRLSAGLVQLPWTVSAAGAIVYLAPMLILRGAAPMIRAAVSGRSALDLIPFWSFFRFILTWSIPYEYHGTMVKDGVGAVRMETHYDMDENFATLVYTLILFYASFVRVIGLYFLVRPWL